MNTGELIDDLIAGLADWRGATFAALRQAIREADPAIVEEWKWRGTPVWSDHGIVCLAKAFKDKVKLTFIEGASLPDPHKLFNNELEGNQWRAIDLYKGDAINEGALIALVRAAVEHNRAKVKAPGKAR
jgi:hypothetical protein